MAVLHYGSLSPVVLGEEPLVGGVPCDPMALAQEISGFCTNDDVPNGHCCMAVVSGIDRGSNPPCFCNVIQQDVMHKSGIYNC
ncbi:hypothetical protein PAHAL_9G143500 [Panicum hallii]|uniref:Bifunctional inhibitor/plant lipid transfer protein/seed storage helical domain-containing protein n=1 Tax=Panicum hallii TaxID=206008 RepID=A0A2S3IJK1_9POAL|nr:hypothetical protein PAHAL_9G143500 [Panicum hallii]